jgi:hypothetical protein
MALSSMCGDRNHETCTKLRMRCACNCHAQQNGQPAANKSTSRKAPARNSARPRGTPKPAPIPQNARGPVIELVKADPPPVVKKSYYRPLSEQVRPFLEQILVAGDRDWFRLVLFFKAMSAPVALRKVRQAYSKTEWQFEARKLDEVGQSAIYVRWIGQEGRTSL